MKMKKRLSSKQTKELRALGYTGGDRIADLIEYLGDDLDGIYQQRPKGFHVEVNSMVRESAQELCDALHIEVKYKLTNV